MRFILRRCFQKKLDNLAWDCPIKISWIVRKPICLEAYTSVYLLLFVGRRRLQQPFFSFARFWFEIGEVWF